MEIVFVEFGLYYITVWRAIQILLILEIMIWLTVESSLIPVKTAFLKFAWISKQYLLGS